jgi:hypothetical protein
MFSITTNGIYVNDIIKIDINQSYILSRIKNFSKDNFEFNENEKLWYYNKYKSKERLIDILFSDKKFTDIKFKNSNYNDYIPENIDFIIEDKFENKFNAPENYEILKDGTSHLIKEGACAGEYRNMYWKVKDKDDNTYYMIHIKDNIYTKISKRDINKVLNFKDIRPVWRLFTNGYICCTININSKQKVYYLHQLIMDVHDENLTNFEKTVDHINRDKLDNRRDNLRLVNMSIQNTNRDKATRRCDAIDLPEGIKQEDIPKHIVYRKEILDKDTGKFREYFYICNHPNFSDNWSSSKSQKINIKEKLKQAKLKIQEIEGLITTKQYNKESGLNNKITFPKYIRLINDNNKKQLCFDARIDNKRYNMKSICKTDNIEEEIDKFIILVNKKYVYLDYHK